MKKLAFILLAMVCSGFTILAQSPGLFNYQAVVRNSNGDLIMNSDINFRISIREGSSDGTTVFSETQLVQSNSYGVCNLKIGDGNNITGSLSGIDWSSGTYFLQIETDASGGESFTETGTVQLLSVPYAMYANAVSNTDDADADSTNEIQDLNLDNNILTITGNPDATSISLAAYQGANTDNQELNLTGTDLSITGGNSINVSSLVNDADADPTNELQNLTFSGDTLGIENGNHIIFPYDSSRWALNGQSIYYNTGNVGIGSSSPRSKLEVKADASFTVDDTLFSVKDKDGNIVFAVFPDGAKVYVNEGVKGRVGGFAVTGRNPTKAPLAEEEYLRVTPDSTRIWVTEDPTKARVGGFAVTGRNPTKGMSGDYLVVSSDSTRIYINDTTMAKRRVGGFAVTGRNPTKGPNDDYLRVTRDSTRVYVTESETKGRVGGFAVTGRNPTKGDVTSDYFNVSGNTDAEIVNNEPRVMWYPKKGALLAGEVHVGSADSVGTNSTALGYRSIAMGEQSQSFGFQTQALGNYSTAIGNKANAEGESSFAFGTHVEATGNYSFALGGPGSFHYYHSGWHTDTAYAPKAIADYSYAFGMGSIANKEGAIAIGAIDTASGQNSLAMGYATTAKGNFSTTMGHTTTASGAYSTAMGRGTTASGEYSTAMGESTTVGGKWSIATGIGTIVNGNASIGMGYYTNVNGDLCTAIGYYAKASSSYAISIGEYTVASEYNSTAIGVRTKASAYASTAIGNHTTARSFAEVVIGQYNDTTFSTSGSWKTTDPLFVIGNGYNSGFPDYIETRKNAIMVLKNGNTGIGGYPGATGSNVFAILNGSIPTSSISNGVLLYSEDVTSSAELKVRDEVGNITTLSPHNFSFIEKSEPMAWSYYSENEQLGYKINVDILNAIRKIEELSGEKLVYMQDLKTKQIVKRNSSEESLVETVEKQQTRIEKLEHENLELKQKLNEIIELLKKE